MTDETTHETARASRFGADARLQQRYCRERRFRRAGAGALIVSALFLVIFFANMIYAGAPAFFQTQIRAPVDFSAAEQVGGRRAVPDRVEPFVSRGFLRLLPQRVESNPELAGSERTQWLLARADVDQYRKGKANALDGEAAAVIDRLEAEGRLRYAFNHWLFTHGDSKLPELSGLKAAIVGSLYVLALTLAFAFPVGVMTAVYLEEFAPDNRLTQAIEININNLAAVPSILFGLLGLAIFINFFGVPRSSALAGGLTLALMTLPIVIISTRAALRAVPDNIREGALAMGATRWQTVRDHVLPMSLPGILTGTIIGLAQAMGETAPLLLIGMIAYIPDAPSAITGAATVLPAQIFTWAGMPEQAYESRTAAAILILLGVLIALNATAVYLRKKFERRW